LGGAVLGGCATPQVAMLDARWPTELPAQVELTDVPFFPQEDYECGPAALAMVAHAAGVDVTPDALVDQVYLPGRKGSLQPEMLAATRRQGLLAYPLKPKVEHTARSGRPPGAGVQGGVLNLPGVALRGCDGFDRGATCPAAFRAHGAWRFHCLL
jgi:hypothetical protein